MTESTEPFYETAGAETAPAAETGASTEVEAPFFFAGNSDASTASGGTTEGGASGRPEAGASDQHAAYSERRPNPESLASRERGADGGRSQEDRGPIPYDRFQQVIQERDRYKAWDPIVEMLRAQGFDSPDAVHEALQAQRAHQAQQAEEQWQNAQAEAIQQAVATGRLPAEMAEQQFQMVLQQRQLEHDRAMFHEWRQGQEMQTAYQQYPNMDPDFVRTLARATGKSVAEVAKISHDYYDQIASQVLARYQADRAAAAAQPAPEGSGGHPPTPTQAGLQAWRQPWRSLFGIGRSG